MDERTNFAGLKKPKLFSLDGPEGQGMHVEYPRVEDALAKQARTSERFKENVFRSFAKIKTVFESQAQRIGVMEDRQDRIEENQEHLKQLCDYNFRIGSDHLQYLLNSNEHCFGLLEAAGEQLTYLAEALTTLKRQVDTDNSQRIRATRDFSDFVTKELKSLTTKVGEIGSGQEQLHQDFCAARMNNSQRMSDLETKLKLVEQRLEGFQAPAIQKDLSELEDRVRKADQKVAVLTEANKIAAVEDRRTVARLELVEAGLEGVKTTLAPLQELLKDNQAVEPREIRPHDTGDNPLTTSSMKETAFLGLDLEGASLADLKKLRSLVNKKIKAASKQKAEPNVDDGEATISYEKPQEGTVPEGGTKRPPTDMAPRAGITHRPTSNPKGAHQGANRDSQRPLGKNSEHRTAGNRPPNNGAGKLNDEDWVTVKRSNWNKFKELAGTDGSQKTSVKNQKNTQAAQQPQKQDESRHGQGSGKPWKGTQSNRRTGNRGVRGSQGVSQMTQGPQIVVPTVNPALVNPFHFSQFGINTSNPGLGLHYPIGGTFHNGPPQQRTFFGY